MLRSAELRKAAALAFTFLNADGREQAVPRGVFVGVDVELLHRGPILPVEVEITQPIAEICLERVGSFAAAHVLVRLHRRPLGVVLIGKAPPEADSGRLAPEYIARRIWEDLGGAIVEHLLSDGLPVVDKLSVDGIPHENDAPCSWRRQLGTSRPSATIAIATCGRSIPQLIRVVRSALDQTYGDSEVLVVDNRPGESGLPAPLADAFPDERRLFYVTEPKRGLAAVRNRSALESTSEIIALTDDDVVLDQDWLGFLVAGFDEPNVACVTGLILPSELETPAQLLIEEFGGFSKGFERRRWDAEENRLSHPLYPYLFGMYGSGANAAWKRDRLEAIGGYDPRLGAGTACLGGEDLDIYVSCIQAGLQLVYEPAAMVRHEHRREVDLLRRQVFGYGVGLGAVLAKRLSVKEERAEMLVRLPAGLHYLFSAKSPKNLGKSARYPRSLTLSELVGIVYGPLAFLRSRRSQ